MGLLQNTFYPMLMESSSAFIAITTPNGSNSVMNSMSKKCLDGKPIFKYLNLGKVCIQCEAYGVTSCHHGYMMNAPWLDKDRRQKIMPVLYDGNEEMIKQEIYAEITESHARAFKEADIAHMLQALVHFPSMEKRTIIVFCDPSGGKSQLGLASAYYYEGKMVVSCLFRALIISSRRMASICVRRLSSMTISYPRKQCETTSRSVR